VPSRAAKPAPRGTLTRDAARRQAVDVLRLGESMCAYAAGQLANGLSAEQARQAALDAAADLAELSAALRRLTSLDLDPAQRRALAVELAASGMSQRQIAEQLGVSKKTIWTDLGGPPRGGPRPPLAAREFPIRP
jgi:DNA-binding NarL/FixJ family response regulator